MSSWRIHTQNFFKNAALNAQKHYTTKNLEYFKETTIEDSNLQLLNLFEFPSENSFYPLRIFLSSTVFLNGNYLKVVREKHVPQFNLC